MNYNKKKLYVLLTECSALYYGIADFNRGPVTGYECPLCEAVLPSLVDIRQHIDVHYPRDSPICPVDSCARRFSHPNSVRNHMRHKHTIQWEKMKNLKWST